MKARDARLLETIQRVELFLHEQEERLQEIVTLPAKAQLANAKSWMVKAAAARERQGYEAAASVARKRELRDAVRTGMQRIVIATKLLPVQCPRLARIRVGREDMATGRLVLAAKVLVAEATPYQAGLIAQGLQEGSFRSWSRPRRRSRPATPPTARHGTSDGWSSRASATARGWAGTRCASSGP